MNHDYTPTTEDVRAEYVANRAMRVSTTTPIASEFDGWLVEELAKAWDAGYVACHNDYQRTDGRLLTPNPHRNS